MTAPNHISPSEEALLTAVGYLIIRWNYAENFVRQILRHYVDGESLEDEEHLRLSGRSAAWLEERLERAALPLWGEPGRPYLETLVLAFSRAREHRNHLVHGIYMTSRASPQFPALAILIPNKPIEGKPQAPSHVSVDEIRVVAHHCHDLAMFARDVYVGFSKDGARALNANGTPVLAELPAHIRALDKCTYVTL